jgi:hypothetical protein
MTERRCKLCRDERWICEEHPDQPMGARRLQRCWRPALQSSRRAGSATGASAGVHDHRRPEARPRVTKRRAGGVIQQKAPARREAWEGLGHEMRLGGIPERPN